MTDIEKQVYMEEAITNAKNLVNGFFKDRKRTFKMYDAPQKIKEAIAFLAKYS